MAVCLFVAMLVAGVIAWAVLNWLDSPVAWRGFWPATGVSVVAAVLSMLPLWIGGSFGLMGAVGGYFVSSALRVVVLIAGCMALVWWYGAPLKSTLLVMCIYYVAVLTTETILLARKLWSAPTTAKFVHK